MGLVGTGMLEELKEQIKKAFTKIKLELNDHREGINENTNEIQANYEYLCRLDSKIEKLQERMDELSLFMDQLMSKTKKTYTVQKLTSREQEVFMVLYAQEEQGTTIQDIARKVALSTEHVSLYLTNLMMKGVPIVTQVVNDSALYLLDPEFKTCQTKENIVGITPSIATTI